MAAARRRSRLAALHRGPLDRYGLWLDVGLGRALGSVAVPLRALVLGSAGRRVGMGPWAALGARVGRLARRRPLLGLGAATANGQMATRRRHPNTDDNHRTAALLLRREALHRRAERPSLHRAAG